MSRSRSLQVAGLLALLVVGPGAAQTRADGIATLTSPNEEAAGLFGHQVSNAGDVNQDGVPDVIVGAHRENPGGSPTDAGRAYVFSGQDQSLLFELKSPNEEASGWFGFSVSGAGDVNQDGFADVIVGAYLEDPGANPSAGRAYVFSGQDGSLLFELVSPNVEGGGRFGFAVAGAGDLDQDGFADVIVGAPNEDPGASPSGAGRAYVFSGQDGSVLLELVSPHDEALGRFGFSVASAGNVDNDGPPDLIVGAEHEAATAGRAYVFDGQSGNLLFELNSPNAQEDGNMGNAVSAAGDVNQDGFADVVVGAFHEFPGSSPEHAGRAYIFSGLDGGLLYELVSPNESEDGHFGISLAAAGDVDGDGTVDVIVGAYDGHEVEGTQDGILPHHGHEEETQDGIVPHHGAAGHAYIFSGVDGSLLIQIGSPNEEDEGLFGVSVAGAGDVNQDGLADVIVGAHQENPDGSPTDAGRAYLFVTSARQQLLVNGGFEGGNCNPWVLVGPGASCRPADPYPHGGAGYAQLSGNVFVGRIYQTVSIPWNSTGELKFWLNVSSQETTNTLENDRLLVEVRDNTSNAVLETLGTFSNLDKTTPGNYSHHGFSMAAFAGQTVRLTFRFTSNATLVTQFRIDDVVVR